MPVRSNESGFVISGDPYLDVERQKTVFDTVLTSEGILAVQLHVRNTGDRRVIVQGSDMVLEFPDGVRLTASGGGAVATKISHDIGGVAGPALAFGLIGALTATHGQNKARAARTADYTKKELPPAILGGGQASEGFVYFIGPENAAYARATLNVHVVDADTGASRIVRLPLGSTDPPHQQPKRP